MTSFDRRIGTGGTPGLGKYRRGRAWAYVRACLTLGVVLGAGAVGTMAAWSDSATATSGTFSVGETEVLRLAVSGDASVHQFLTLDRSSMLRGQSAAGGLEVQNTGTVDFDWAISAQASGSQDLIDVLQVGLFSGESADGSTCDGAQIGTTQAMSPSPTLATSRRVVAGESETICVQVTVRSDAGIAARRKVAEPSFTVVAGRA